MNVSLTPELESFVQKEVKSGLYQTASEVVRAGLRRLKQDLELRPSWNPETLEELESHLLESVRRLDRSGGVESEAVFRRLRKRMRVARGRA